jgi:hypothetical protein
MPRPTEIQNIIEEAVAEVLDAALPRLRAEIVRRAVEVVESLAPAPGASPTDVLNAAATAIQEAASQAEILRRLLEGEARFAGRVALFVVKGATVNGWQGIGFEDNEGVKNISVSATAGLAGKAIQARSMAEGATNEFDSGFISTVKAPAENRCLVLPLVVKEKVAAVIYADGGVVPGGALDASGLQSLTRFAALWLELAALRKAGGAATEDVPQAATVGANSGAAAVAVTEEDELHKKAKRFAKLLVEEIKLYNQSKVNEGRQHKDLYDRLKIDIEKSRATYDKRYSESAVASADYFTQELVRILADNDVSLMGAGFSR